MLQPSKSLLWILLITLVVKCASSSALQIESPGQKEPAKIKTLTEVGHSNLEDATAVLNHGHKLYYFFRNQTLSWYDAFAYCRNIGMSLASPSTETEASFIKQFLIDKKLMVREIRFYWLSLNDLGWQNYYFWMSTGKRINYKPDYIPGEPNHRVRDGKTEVEHCVLYGLSDEHVGWRDEHCSDKHGFICEK